MFSGAFPSGSSWKHKMILVSDFATNLKVIMKEKNCACFFLFSGVAQWAIFCGLHRISISISPIRNCKPGYIKSHHTAASCRYTYDYCDEVIVVCPMYSHLLTSAYTIHYIQGGQHLSYMTVCSFAYVKYEYRVFHWVWSSEYRFQRLITGMAYCGTLHFTASSAVSLRFFFVPFRDPDVLLR